MLDIQYSDICILIVYNHFCLKLSCTYFETNKWVTRLMVIPGQGERTKAVSWPHDLLARRLTFNSGFIFIIHIHDVPNIYIYTGGVQGVTR